MEALLNGWKFRRVARPAVKAVKSLPAPAPTHPPREAERDAREKRNGMRNVTLESAPKVWKSVTVSIQFT